MNLKQTVTKLLRRLWIYSVVGPTLNLWSTYLNHLKSRVTGLCPHFWPHCSFFQNILGPGSFIGGFLHVQGPKFNTHPPIHPPQRKTEKKTHFSRALSFYDTSHINVRGFVLVTLPQEPWDSFPPCEFTNSSAFPSHSASSSPPSFSLPPCDSGALPVTVPSSLLLFPFLHVCYHWSIFFIRDKLNFELIILTSLKFDASMDWLSFSFSLKSTKFLAPHVIFQLQLQCFCVVVASALI